MTDSRKDWTAPTLAEAPRSREGGVKPARKTYPDEVVTDRSVWSRTCSRTGSAAVGDEGAFPGQCAVRDQQGDVAGLGQVGPVRRRPPAGLSTQGSFERCRQSCWVALQSRQRAGTPPSRAARRGRAPVGS